MPETEVIIPRSAFLPRYQHLTESTHDINFIYGGRDAGRSHYTAQKLIYDCIRLPYFRCLLIKKTFNSIKESQWQTIKDIVDNWGFSELFKFTTHPLSIECVNGNKFIARGCDDPQSIKSVKDPSHAWYEEGNQLTMDDFITVTTTLRTNKTKIQQWFCFNPECDGDFEDFWLYKTFFKGRELSGEYAWNVEDIVYSYSITHSTYKDNRYCKPERRVFLEQLKDIDPYYYQVYTLGLWGRRQNNSPFVYAFDRNKHLGSAELNKRFEVIISFDFNRSPICATVWQQVGAKINCIEAIKLDNSDIYKLCDYIRARYGDCLLAVTGDATGRASSALVQNGLNYYSVIKAQLNLSQNQLKVPMVNPPVKESQVMINAAFYKLDITLDKDRCKPLVFDLENVRVQADGQIEKRDRNDPSQQADLLDTARYYFNTFHKAILKL